MKKNKIAALALSGALLVGATALGTFAYFNDTAKTSNNLVVTTGTLRLGSEESDWYVCDLSDGDSKNETDLKTESKKLDENKFENVRPGDTFKKYSKFKNNGTLKQRLTFNIDELNNAVLAKDINGNKILVSDIFDIKYAYFNTSDEENATSSPEVTLEDNKYYILNPNESITMGIEMKFKKEIPNIVENIDVQGIEFDLEKTTKNTITVIADQLNKGK